MQKVFSTCLNPDILELHLVVGGVPLPVARVLVDEHAASLLVLLEDGKVFRKCLTSPA